MCKGVPVLDPLGHKACSFIMGYYGIGRDQTGMEPSKLAGPYHKCCGSRVII